MRRKFSCTYFTVRSLPAPLAGGPRRRILDREGRTPGRPLDRPNRIRLLGAITLGGGSLNEFIVHYGPIALATGALVAHDDADNDQGGDDDGDVGAGSD